MEESSYILEKYNRRVTRKALTLSFLSISEASLDFIANFPSSFYFHMQILTKTIHENKFSDISGEPFEIFSCKTTFVFALQYLREREEFSGKDIQVLSFKSLFNAKSKFHSNIQCLYIFGQEVYWTSAEFELFWEADEVMWNLSRLLIRLTLLSKLFEELDNKQIA